MAFNAAYLKCIDTGPVNLWRYDTLDAPATVAAANYWSSTATPTVAKDMMRKGDLVIVVQWGTSIFTTVGTITQTTLTTIMTNDGVNVDSSTGTALTMTG